MPVGNILKKIIGSSNDRVLRSLRSYVIRINDLERKYADYSDDELRETISNFKIALQAGQTLEEVLVDTFAIVREASKRTLKMRHFDVQLVGGLVLHQGKIAEMKTGEGKTLMATLPAVLNALSGNGVHIVTVNDYLARRDAEWMGQIYRFLGLSVGVVYSGMPEAAKREAYAADITYGQNNEFGFDYLRDNMKHSADELVQRGHNFAIVDEVDSILIDEARTPLIISGPAEDSSDLYYSVNKIIPKLQSSEHYDVDLKSKHPSLNEAGIARVEELLGVENLYDPANIQIVHHTNQALRAHTTMTRDVDYVVKDGQVIIVDEFTGRLMPGRRWSDGLHQAIEAKEGLKIARENQTLASITFQNLFRLYDKLSGMTGTAVTEAVEFKEIYKLDVVVIPPNRPMVRDDQSDMVFRTRAEKYQAVVKDIIDLNKSGQPILVGTISIEQSEELSRQLTKAAIKHQVLNAKHHEREAQIIAQAGRYGAVTIATNMAGRGTDIVLGGNPEGLAADQSGSKDPENTEFKKALEQFQEKCQEEKEQVIAAGGLFILGTERHESRRIDNQLRGRAGRQGDPGASRFYISLEDDLMKRFGGDRLQHLMKRMGWEEGAAIDGRLISRSIESAQKRVERYHFESRKHVTEYDDVMNKQRQVIYNLRNRILRSEGIRDEILSMLDDLCEDTVLAVCDDRQKSANWNLAEIQSRIKFLTNQNLAIPANIDLRQQAIFDFVRTSTREHYLAHASRQAEILSETKKSYEQRGVQISLSENAMSAFDFRYETFEQSTLLESVDRVWLLHLQQMDHLKESVGLQGYGQKNPKYEYQREGFVLFSNMLDQLKESAIRRLCFYDATELEQLLQHIANEQKRRQEMENRMNLSHAEDEQASRNGHHQDLRDPESSRAKLDAQRKARRKARARR